MALGPRSVPGQHLHDIGNDVAGPFNHDGVADTNVLTRDFIHVVQRGALYDNPADGDGLQARNRGQSAGATHLGLYVENAGGSLAGLELVSDGPPWRARNRAQSTLELGAVDLYNQAIDFVRQIVAPSLHLLALPKDFFHALADASKGYRLKAPVFHRLKEFQVTGEAHSGDRSCSMTE